MAPGKPKVADDFNAMINAGKDILYWLDTTPLTLW